VLVTPGAAVQVGDTLVVIELDGGTADIPVSFESSHAAQFILKRKQYVGHRKQRSLLGWWQMLG
jgi:hypothetical protein